MEKVEKKKTYGSRIGEERRREGGTNLIGYLVCGSLLFPFLINSVLDRNLTFLINI